MSLKNVFYKQVIHERSVKYLLISQNFDFLNLTNLSPGQFLGSSNSRRYH